jgi:hypothetical protein
MVKKLARRCSVHTCCIDTNSASIATNVPGVGISWKRRGSCFIKELSRFLTGGIRYRIIKETFSDSDIEVSRLRIDGSISSGKPLKSRFSCMPARSMYRIVGTFGITVDEEARGKPKYTNLPFSGETQSLIFCNIANNEVVEQDPRTFIIPFGFGD